MLFVGWTCTRVRTAILRNGLLCSLIGFTAGLTATPALVSLDIYGWDVEIVRMFRLPPLRRLYWRSEKYCDHVIDRVSVALRSVVCTRGSNYKPYVTCSYIPNWLCWPLHLRSELRAASLFYSLD